MRWGTMAIAALALVSIARAAEPAGATDLARYAGSYMIASGFWPAGICCNTAAVLKSKTVTSLDRPLLVYPFPSDSIKAMP